MFEEFRSDQINQKVAGSVPDFGADDGAAEESSSASSVCDPLADMVTDG